RALAGKHAVYCAVYASHSYADLPYRGTAHEARLPPQARTQVVGRGRSGRDRRIRRQGNACGGPEDPGRHVWHESALERSVPRRVGRAWSAQANVTSFSIPTSSSITCGERGDCLISLVTTP